MMYKKILTAIFTILLASCSNAASTKTTSSSETSITPITPITPSTPSAPVGSNAGFTVSFVDERPQVYQDVTLDWDGVDVLIQPDQTVYDFSLVSVSALDQAGEIFWQIEPAYTLDTLSPDEPLIATINFTGDVPNYGITYLDADGNYNLYVIQVSGQDGSLMLVKAKQAASQQEATNQQEGVKEAHVACSYPDQADYNAEHQEGILDSDGIDVLFTSSETITDVTIVKLTMEDVSEDGHVIWSSEACFWLHDIAPDYPCILTMAFPGDLPSYGITYTDVDGGTKFKVIQMSGVDGSLLLSDN